MDGRNEKKLFSPERSSWKWYSRAGNTIHQRETHPASRCYSQITWHRVCSNGQTWQILPSLISQFQAQTIPSAVVPMWTRGTWCCSSCGAIIILYIAEQTPNCGRRWLQTCLRGLSTHESWQILVILSHAKFFTLHQQVQHCCSAHQWQNACEYTTRLPVQKPCRMYESW